MLEEGRCVKLIEDVKSLHGLSFGKGYFNHYDFEDMRFIKANPKRSFVHIQSQKGAIVILVPEEDTDCIADEIIENAELIRVGGLLEREKWTFVMSSYIADGKRNNKRMSRNEGLDVYLEKAMCVFQSID